MHKPPLILIAEDEYSIVQLLELTCTRQGYQVLIAQDGREAIRLATDNLPDLILLDVQMPLMNGFEVLAYLRGHETTHDIPIIILTAVATRPEQRIMGIEIGADDYILKPFNTGELLARIRAKLQAKELEERLKKRTQELETLVRLGVHLTQHTDLKTLAAELLSFLSHELDLNFCALHLRADNISQALTLFHTPEQEMKINWDKLIKLATSERLLTPKECQKFLGLANFQSALVIPLMHQGLALGVLLLADNHPNRFDAETLQVAQSINLQTTFAFRNAQLYEHLRAHAEDLEARVLERTAALQQIQLRLTRSEKLASLGRLAGEIAHEINNPLQPIMGCLETALEDIEDATMPDPEGLQIALSEVRRLQRTVKSLQDYARPDSEGVTWVDLHDLINEVLRLTQKKLSTVQLKTEFEPLPPLHANPDQLKQVMLNLVINAVDAMQDLPHKAELAIKLWTDNNYAHISVTDNGVGIPPERLAQIFDPYYSTKEDGTGLGLAISYSIVNAHGGTLDVQSALDQGATFRVSLPLA